MSEPGNLSPPPRKYFGTDGVRGRVDEWPITAEFMLKLGRAAGVVLGCHTTTLIFLHPPAATKCLPAVPSCASRDRIETLRQIRQKPSILSMIAKTVL